MQPVNVISGKERIKQGKGGGASTAVTCLGKMGGPVSPSKETMDIYEGSRQASGRIKLGDTDLNVDLISRRQFSCNPSEIP